MKWKKYGPILWTFAIVSFIVATLEGFFYYAQYSQYPLFRLLMTLENSLKAFVFVPVIDIKSVMAGLESASPFRLAVGYAYGLAVFIAPLCTATALLMWAELTVRRIISGWRSWKRTPVLIFGHNENVRTLLRCEHSTGSGQYQIYSITNGSLGDDEELWLLRHGAIPLQADFLSAQEARRKKLFRQLPMDRVRQVLLMDNSPTRNFSIYRMLTEDNSPLRPEAQCYCLCEDEAARCIIETACDQRLTSDGKQKTAELTLFSLAEMKAESIFSALEGDIDSSMPLHTVNLNRPPDCTGRLDVHLLIAGFGAVGQQVLLQAINLGVLSSRNRLWIDVVDLDMDKERELFTNRFHISVYDSAQENELLVTAPTADGELRIRFHQLDVMGRSFALLLEQVNKEMPLTYAAVCMGKADTGMHCIVELKKLDGNFPIALRMENDLQAAGYLKQDNGTYKEVFPIAVSDHIMRISNICHKERERQARQFNKIYGGIRLLPPDAEADGPPQKERPWHTLKMYQRRANIFLYLHQTVKNALGNLTQEQRERCFGKEGRVLRRGSDGSYRCRYEGRAMADAINAVKEVRELAMTEHRRWCYVMAMQGWHYAAQKNEARRQTPYLTTWDKLCEDHPDVAVYDLIPYLAANETPLGEDTAV